MTRTLIVFGAGPGIGNVRYAYCLPHISLTYYQNTAVAFAKKGIDHIILLARDIERLQSSDAPFVSKASSSVKVETVRIDLADPNFVPSVLKQLDDLTQGENVEVVFFNAATIKPNDVLGVSVDEIHEDFKVCFVQSSPALIA